MSDSWWEARAMGEASSQRTPPLAPVEQSCRNCGTQVPAAETLCAICARKGASSIAAGAGRTTLVNWLLTLAIMAAIFVAGTLLSH